MRQLERLFRQQGLPAGWHATIIDRDGKVVARSEDTERFVAFAPDVIYGLPSALLEVGRTLQSRGSKLDLRMLFTSGELLNGSRAALKSLYDAPVYDIYGTSETKEIAWQCPQGGMHLNNDVVRLEVLDDSGRSLPAGQEGELIVRGPSVMPGPG